MVQVQKDSAPLDNNDAIDSETGPIADIGVRIDYLPIIAVMLT